MPILKREPDLYPRDLFDRTAVAAPWVVAHLRSRQEKTLARHLVDHRIPYYLPQREKLAHRGGRHFTSYLPLFNGYLFLRCRAVERLTVLRSHVVVRLLEARDQRRLHEQLESLWQLQRSGAPLVPHPYIAPGDEVEIIGGALKGWRGIVLREKGKTRLVVSVEFLRQSVAAELDRDLLAPAAEAPRLGRAVAR